MNIIGNTQLNYILIFFKEGTDLFDLKNFKKNHPTG